MKELPRPCSFDVKVEKRTSEYWKSN